MVEAYETEKADVVIALEAVDTDDVDQYGIVD